MSEVTSSYIVHSDVGPIDIESVPGFDKLRVGLGDLSLHLTRADAETLCHLLTRELAALEAS